MKDDKKIIEEYEDFVGKDGLVNPLAEIIGISSVSETEAEAEKHLLLTGSHGEKEKILWDKFGMPEFESHKTKPKINILFNFNNEEDVKKFSELIDYKLTPKTRSVTFPFREKDENILKRFIEVEDDD